MADGQLLEGIDLVLPRGAVIAGRVTDEFGEPVADAIVQAMRFQFYNGQRRLAPTGRGAQTDDIGHYRLHGLQPGDYFISARVMGAQMPLPPGAASLGASESTVGFAPTYFPGTPVYDRAVAEGIIKPLGLRFLRRFSRARLQYQRNWETILVMLTRLLRMAVRRKSTVIDAFLRCSLSLQGQRGSNC